MATLREEIERRRTFAIISHPDAGKTTLTEKLLLYAVSLLPPLFYSSTIRASASTFWIPPATRTSPRIPTAP